MVSLRGQDIGRVPLADAVRQLKLVPQSRYDDAARASSASTAALDLLRWRSQASNTKLRRLAERIENFRDTRDEAIGSRSAFDHALLNGERVRPGRSSRMGGN